MLGLHHRPLLSESVVIWPNGPAVPSVYRRYRESSGDYISREGTNGCAVIDIDAQRILKHVFQVYGKYSSVKIAMVARQRGSPWDKTKRSGGATGSTITDHAIQKYFSALASRERTAGSQSRIIDIAGHAVDAEVDLFTIDGGDSPVDSDGHNQRLGASNWDRIIPWYLTGLSTAALVAIALFLVSNVNAFRVEAFGEDTSDLYVFRFHAHHLHASLTKRSIGLFSGFALIFIGMGVSFYHVRSRSRYKIEGNVAAQSFAIEAVSASPGILATILGAMLVFGSIASKDGFSTYRGESVIRELHAEDGAATVVSQANPIPTEPE